MSYQQKARSGMALVVSPRTRKRSNLRTADQRSKLIAEPRGLPGLTFVSDE